MYFVKAQPLIKRNKSMRKQTWKAAFSAAAIAAGAIISMAANADTLYVTNTIGNVSVTPVSDVKWLFKIDTSAKKAYPGTNSAGAPNGSWNSNTALALDPQKTVTIPRSVTVDGETYSITEIIERAFYNDKTIENVVALENIETVGWRSFYGTPIKNVLFKGPNTSSDGSQPVVSIKPTLSGSWVPFENAKSLKLVIIGPGLKPYYDAARLCMKSAKNASILVPDSPSTWNALNEDTVGGTNNRVVRYGPKSDFGMAMGDTEMTFYPKNVNGLTNVLSWVSTIKSAFGMDARISVTNTIDLTGVTITEQMVSQVTFDRLMFSAKTQAELNAILAVFPATTPISIDPTGLTENMTISDDYPNVFVKIAPGVSIKRVFKGFIISVK